MRPASYEKFAYWLPGDEFRAFQQEYEYYEHKTIFIPERFPCEVLGPARLIGAVMPETWNNACNRQGSWYRTSEKVRMFLLVSRKNITFFTAISLGTCIYCRFSPPSTTISQGNTRFYTDPAYTTRAPAEWPLFSMDEKVRYPRFFDIHSISLSLDEVMIHQSTNYAIFCRRILSFEWLKAANPGPTL